MKHTFATAVIFTFLVTASSLTSASAATPSTELADIFTLDSSLSGTWIINGPVATAALANFDSPVASIIAPTISFSSQLGLGIGGIAGGYQQAGIQSVQSFSAPFTVITTGVITAASAGALEVAISSANGGSGVAIQCGAGGGVGINNGCAYATPSGPGTHWNQSGLYTGTSQGLGPLQLNVPYMLTIAVNSQGQATVTVAFDGKTLAEKTASVGTGPFYVILGEGAGFYFTGGANQAWWEYLEVQEGAAEPQEVELCRSETSGPPFLGGNCLQKPDTAGAAESLVETFASQITSDSLTTSTGFLILGILQTLQGCSTIDLPCMLGVLEADVSALDPYAGEELTLAIDGAGGTTAVACDIANAVAAGYPPQYRTLVYAWYNLSSCQSPSP